MARRRESEQRQARQRQSARAQIFLMGAVLLVVAIALPRWVGSGTARSLAVIGLTLLGIGFAWRWIERSGHVTTKPWPVIDPDHDDASARRTVATPSWLDQPSLAHRPSLMKDVGQAPDRPTEWSPNVFKMIEWRRFEAVVEALFSQAGFETQAQSHGADEGVDIWLYSRNAPGTPVSLVQCKHWQGKRVGVDKIRELCGVMAHKGVKRGQFATTSTFTPDAIAFAKENSINLLDIDALLALISQRSSEQQAELLEVALQGDYGRPTCVNCGVKMTERVPRKGGNPFWGCINYPRCKTTMVMRAS